jgi:hypothetical protein
MDGAVVKRERYSVWDAMLAGLMLVTAVWLSNITEYGSGNDANYNLGNGYAIDPADPFLHKLHDSAVANCPAEDNWCIGYQQLILSDLHFNYPIFALFGRLLPLLHPGEPFGAAAATATLAAVTTGFVLAMALFLLVQAKLPARSRVAIALMFLIGAPVVLLARESPFHQPDIHTSVTWIRLAAYLGIIAAAWCTARLAVVRRLAERLHDWLVSASVRPLVVMAIAGIVVMFGCRLAFPESPIVWGAGVVLFLAMMVMSCLLARTGFITGITIVFLIFLTVNPIYFFAPVTYASDRGNIFLATAALITYLVRYPNGRFAWLLPALALFHVSLCSVVATALFAMEACVFLWRRRVTLLLGVSAAVMILGRLFTSLSFHGFGSSVGLRTVAGVVVESDRFLPGMLFAAMLGAAGLLLLQRREPKWDPAARVIVLAALLAAGTQITPILDLAKFTLFDPGLAAILLAPHYLGPTLAVAGVATLVTCLLDTANSTASAAAVPRLAVLAFAAIGVLEVVRVSGTGVSPAEWARNAATSLGELASARGKLSRDPLFHRLRADDDVYLLRSHLWPQSDPIIYLSLLKYKMRAAAGLFDPQRAVIETVDGSKAENVSQSAP